MERHGAIGDEAARAAAAHARARTAVAAGASEPEPHVEFRALERADLELLHAWLCDADVARWYSSGAPTRAAVRRKYARRIDGRSPTRVFIARVDGRDAGLAQTYSIAEYPGYAQALGAGPGWFGLDYFIGERQLRGRRLAHRLVGAFVEAVIARMPGAEACASLPALDNVKSIRTLERAGFRALRRVTLAPDRIDVVMTRRIADDRKHGSRR